jgi:tetratricopeptide (TPR) repeat protein/predicted Ser/Thr protein kinase
MDHPISADSRLSNYRLERLLGSGGMGEVYLARDLALDRPVAIKFIAPDKVGDTSARRRLIREARAAAALDHPNICGVHEVIDTPDGRACIVMQYLEGRTLAEVLRDGPADVRLALTIAADLASALAVAHKRGVIHRDLKPRNIIITPDQRARLLDFGVARHASSSADADDGTTTTQLTTPGVIVGTPAYMSPEQVLQRPLDGRSDLFALGAVLFECLTGRRPFDGRGGLEQVSEVLHHDPPPVSSLRSGLSNQHDELVRRLLAKAPADRFGSAEEVLGALRVLLPDEPSSRWISQHKGQRRSNRVRRGMYVAVAIIAVMAGAGMWRWNTPSYIREAAPETWNFYNQGTGWIRDGAYPSARRALTRAVATTAGFVPAYVRLSETCSELDDHRCAQDALNQVRTLVTDEADLRAEDRLRVRAVQALMLRRVDDAVGEYRHLTARFPRDAGAWLDLGRAQETAAMPVDALVSFDRALQLEGDNGAAHLRRATVQSQLGEKEDALREFVLAEDLYRKAGNVDGRTEALLRHGTFLNAINDVSAARQVLERAKLLAETLDHREQSIRIQLQLSSVTASEGQFTRAQELARDAVARALEEDLDTVAADGLIDLGIALLQARVQDAPDPEVLQSIEEPLLRAIHLGEGRNAQRIVARAKMQHAAVLTHFGRPGDALAMVDKVLTFLHANHYRRLEVQGLLIKSRTLEALNRSAEGRRASVDGLQMAEQMKDPAQQAFAHENLAGFAVADGDLPAAEHHRREAEGINRRQKNYSVLPYDLTNRAELLVRLGRVDDAERLLAEVDAGIAKGIEAYKGRTRRVSMIRAMAANVSGRFADAPRLASQALSPPSSSPDGTGRLATALLGYAHGQLGRPVPRGTWDIVISSKELVSDARYWALQARLLSGDAQGVLEDAELILSSKGRPIPLEFKWRITALAAAAARELRRPERAAAFADEASATLDALETEWKEAFSRYGQRSDLSDLVKRAVLNPER